MKADGLEMYFQNFSNLTLSAPGSYRSFFKWKYWNQGFVDLGSQSFRSFKWKIMIMKTQNARIFPKWVVLTENNFIARSKMMESEGNVVERIN